ncbi:MAG: TIGR03013 family XrtA/PEP-CTERM system glycosyltransferase [Halofilum sp. (in: g-proteobacteria)]
MSVLGRYYNELFRFVPLIEGLILFCSIYIGSWLRLGERLHEQGIADKHGTIWPEAIIFAVVLLVSMTAMGLYNKRLRERLEGVIIRLVLAFAVGTMFLAVLFYVFRDMFLGRGVLALSLLTSFAAVVILRAFLGRLLDEPQNRRRIVVLGSGRSASSITRLRRRTDLIGLTLVGFIPVNGEERSVPDERILVPDERLSDWVQSNAIDEVVVAPDERRRNLDMTELMSCRAGGVAVVDINTFIERETGSVLLDAMTPGWFAFSNGIHSPLFNDRVKRLFDITISLIVLTVTLPLIAAAALAIWLESGRQGPIFHRQTRVGRNGKPFEVLKFRSMRNDAERPGQAQWAQRDDPRVTRVGAILRRFRIDELPQLFNILRGDMSFVGPRPERPEFVESLKESCPHYADRHRVKPGLTGWAQIRYPYGASGEDAFRKLQYDLYYVKNRSVFLDLVILLHTAEVVLWGHGVR